MGYLLLIAVVIIAIVWSKAKQKQKQQVKAKRPSQSNRSSASQTRTSSLAPRNPSTADTANQQVDLYLKQCRDCANLINSTANPDVFFGRLQFLLDLLLTLRILFGSHRQS